MKPWTLAPLTDTDLWNHIRHGSGGIKRSRDYWDSHVSSRENRRRFAYLDRSHDQGRRMDELADEIGAVWPWFSINNADDLWRWLNEYTPGKGAL